MSFQAYLDTIEDRTGLTPRQLLAIAHDKGLDAPGAKAGQVVEWFAAEYGLGRGHAMAFWSVVSKGPQISTKAVLGSQIADGRPGTPGTPGPRVLTYGGVS